MFKNLIKKLATVFHKPYEEIEEEKPVTPPPTSAFKVKIVKDNKGNTTSVLHDDKSL